MAYPSTFLDLQNAVAAKMRMDTTDAAQLAKIKDWINQAYFQTCLETEALQESDTIALTSNVSAYTMPTGVMRVKYMAIRQTNQGGYNVPLTLVPLMQILKWRQANAGLATTNGTASYYAISGLNDLDLYPTPATSDTLLMYYVAQPNALSVNADVPAIPEPYATRCLEAGALIEASDYLKDMINNSTYRQTFEMWIAKFRQHLRKFQGTQTKQLAKVAQAWQPPHDPSVDIGAR